MAERVLLSAVRKAVAKKLPIVPDRELARNLDVAADTKAEAYRLGAEETQLEILARIDRLAARSTPTETNDG